MDDVLQFFFTGGKAFFSNSKAADHLTQGDAESTDQGGGAAAPWEQCSGSEIHCESRAALHGKFGPCHVLCRLAAALRISLTTEATAMITMPIRQPKGRIQAGVELVDCVVPSLIYCSTICSTR